MLLQLFICYRITIYNRGSYGQRTQQTAAHDNARAAYNNKGVRLRLYFVTISKEYIFTDCYLFRYTMIYDM